MSRVDFRAVAARVLIIIGLGMLGYYYGTGVYTGVVQNQLQTDWLEVAPDVTAVSTSSRTDTETMTAEAPDLSRGDIFGRLVIPKLGIDVIVLEGADQATLTKGPGHIPGTAWPRQGRNAAISGHRTTFGSPFARLNALERGDLIELTTRLGSYRYRVGGSDVVRPTDVFVIGQGFKDRLTLTTCDPPGSAAKRLAVWAERI